MILALLLLLVSPAPEFVAGAELPIMNVVDENGRVVSTSEWRGTPVILAPIYTSCPLACPLIVRGLKRGAGESTTSPSAYRVVLFSFDRTDTPADLKRFRERNQIPLSWTIVRVNDPRALLDPIGYRFAETKGLYTHPNAIVVLTPRLATARWLFGTDYSGTAVDEALAIAAGRRDWLAELGPWLIAVLLFIALLAAISLVTLLGQKRALSAEMHS